MNAFKYLNAIYGFIIMAFNNETLLTKKDLTVKRMNNNDTEVSLDLEPAGYKYIKSMNKYYDIESDGGISGNYAILFRMMNEERIAVGF